MGTRLIFRIFTITGLLFLVIGCFSVMHTRLFLRRASKAQGIVIQNIWEESGGRSRSMVAYPQVRFQTKVGDVILFKSRSGSNPAAFELNQEVTVVYDVADPHHAYIDSFGQLWALSIIPLAIGAGFTLPELCFVLIRRAGVRKENWLQLNGQRIQAELTEVSLNTSFSANGVHPYRIVCQCYDPITNQMRVYHSANIWFDPTKFIPGKMLEVLVDPNNPHRYSVETPFLPKTE